MSGAAQQQLLDEVDSPAEYQATGTESVTPLKQVVSERLEAHRRRRAESASGSRSAQTETSAASATRNSGASRVREAVAARYKNSVTYREFLAQEAERALEQAQAEADMAARKVKAVAEAQLQLMAEMEQWNQPEPGPREVALAEQKAELRDTLAHAVADIAVAATELLPPSTYDPEAFAAGLTVRMYEDLGAGRHSAAGLRASAAQAGEHEEYEHETLDAEIAFRRAPEFDPFVPQPVGISGNLIEFPRQLVAARKVRPRLAEGPLREESAPEPQLRIFEVEPELISSAPAEPEGAPEWQGMLLDTGAPPKAQTPAEEHFHPTLQPQTARMEVRLMAAAVDASCIAGAFVAFATVVVELCGPALRAMPLPLAGASAGGVLLAMFVIYQLLFFTLNDATPGMRYARIALCTFGDANPSRPALRRRVVATLLAACPLGIGLAWAWMDEDGLGWHDRISRMYQRGY